MGRREGEQSSHLLKSDRVGWGASGRRPKPPGVRGGAAKELDRETLQNRGGAGARTERSLPPPHGVPALCSRASAKHDPRSVPVGPEQAATASSAGRRTGGSARHHRCWPGSGGRRVAGEAADARGWSRRLGEGTDPRLRGGRAAPQRAATPHAASRPRPLPAASILSCSVSEFAGVSAHESRRREAARRRVRSLRGSGSLPSRRGASRVPFGLGVGAYVGWGPRWANRLRRSC